MQLKPMLYTIHYGGVILASPCILMSVISVGGPDGMVVRGDVGSVLTPELPCVLPLELP